MAVKISNIFTLQEYHEEHSLQAFRKFDTNKNGMISLKDLKKILVNLCPHLLSTYVEASLPLVSSAIHKYRKLDLPCTLVFKFIAMLDMPVFIPHSLFDYFVSDLYF